MQNQTFKFSLSSLHHTNLFALNSEPRKGSKILIMHIFWRGHITRLAKDIPADGTSVFVVWCSSKVFWPPIPVEAEDGVQCDSKDSRDIGGLENLNVPRNSQTGIKPSPRKKAMD